LDPSIVLIDFLLAKFTSDKNRTLQVIEQLSEEDIGWSPTAENNSVGNLVAHIWGTVHQRIETAFFHVPDTRDRDREFERGLQFSREKAHGLVGQSFDLILRVLERMRLRPEMLLDQPYLDLPPLTQSGLTNQSTNLEVMLQLMRHLSGHTAQILYIAKMRKGQLRWR